MLAAKSSFSANKTINRTFEIYLPPVPSKVTDPNTIYEHMLYLQSITAKVNMKYAKTTLDVGAAVNAFKELWTYLETYGYWTYLEAYGYWIYLETYGYWAYLETYGYWTYLETYGYWTYLETYGYWRLSLLERKLQGKF